MVCQVMFLGVWDSSRNQTRPFPSWEASRYYPSGSTKYDVLELFRAMKELKQGILKIDNKQGPTV